MAEELYNKSLLSADSHVMEPRDFWETRIDANGATRRPHSRCSTRAATIS